MPNRPKRLKVLLDGPGPRRWHLDLLESLSRVHEGVEATLSRAASPAFEAAHKLFQWETVLNGLPRIEPWGPAPAAEWRRFQVSDPRGADLTIDLSADGSPLSGAVMKVEFDGVAGEAGLVAAAVAGRSPVMRITRGDKLVAAGRLGAENPGVARLALEDMLARARAMILGAVDREMSVETPTLPRGEDTGAKGHAAGSALPKLVSRRLRQRLLRSVYLACFRAPHWRVGWRKIGSGDMFDLRAHPESGWVSLPDDARRFYADPFPILRQRKLTLFVEEYDHARAKGIISAVEFGPDGPLGAPQPVLEQPYHLSYPFVFERDGETWMIPETCGAGRIELYRSRAFPGGWNREKILVDNVVASDATIIERDGKWWMFATVREGGGSYCDALHLWSAPDFRGPWTPHPRNPVLIDSASARPAGRMVERDGALYRPVQDCREGYGLALGIARVDRLDDDGFSQTVETILRPGPLWKGRRLHTLNAAGDFEFIDGSGWAPRWRSWVTPRPHSVGRGSLE